MFNLNFLKKGTTFLFLLLTIQVVSACTDLNPNNLLDKLEFSENSLTANLIVGQTEVYTLNNVQYKVEFRKITDYRYLDHELSVNGQILQIDTSDIEKSYELNDGSKFKLLTYLRIYECTDRNIYDDSMIIDFSITQEGNSFTVEERFIEIIEERTMTNKIFDYLKRIF